MSISEIRTLLFWCSAVNFALLTLWFVLLQIARSRLQRIWTRCFGVSPNQFDMINCAGYVTYKVLILVFNFVPFLALFFVGD